MTNPIAYILTSIRKFAQYTTLAILFLTMMPYSAVIAQEQNNPTVEERQLTPTHALAMHGAPKYNDSAQILDYASKDAIKGGTLKQSVIGNFDSLNAHNIKGKPAAGLHYLYDRLAARVWDEPFSLYGLIAQEILISKNRDRVAFKLHPKARFHDGKQITTADVAFSFETLKTYGRPNTRRVYKLVEDVIIHDTNHIEFRFGEGYDQETALILAMMPVLPKHYWADKNFDSTTLEVPLGSGPYRVSSVDAGRQIIYERVQDYWAAEHLVNKGHHNFDRLVFDYYRDKNVAIQAFKAGKLDIFREFDTASWQNNFANDEDSTAFTTESLPHQRPEWVRALIFNTKNELFQDKNIREALTKSFDFGWMNKTLFHGNAKRITSTFPNTELAYQKDTLEAAPLRSRLKEADQLLQDVGWVVDANQRVHSGTKKPFAFSVLTNDSNMEKVVLHWAQNLKRLGITLTIDRADSAQFTGRLSDYDYDMVLHRWVNSLSPGSEQMIYWGCDAVKTNGSRNYARICDEEIDRLATAIAQAETRYDLVNATKKLDRKLMNSHIMIPLYYIGKDYIAYKPSLQRPSTIPLYGVVLETWWKDDSGAISE